MPRRAQRGVTLLIVVMILLAVAAMGALVAGSISGSDVIDSHLAGYSIEAQFAAESGVERALEEFSNAPYAPPPAAVNPCVAGSFTAGPYTVTANRTFTTAFKASTDFSGNALPFSQCRVQVTGSVTGTAGTPVTRTVQAILDRNLAAGANPGFNDIVGGGATAVSKWTSTSTPIAFDTTGGTDTAPTATIPTRCTRAAYAAKPRKNGTVGQATGSVAIVPNFRVTTGSTQTVTVRFNYRVIQLTNINSNTCATTSAGVALPALTPANNDMHVWFRLTDTANNQYTTVGASVFVVLAARDPGAPLNTRTLAGPACTPTTQQANAGTDYATCATWYQGVAAPVTATNKGQSTVDIAAASTGLIKQLEYFINLRSSGEAREAWIDNIELINSTGAQVARTAEWRDCSVGTCP